MGEVTGMVLNRRGGIPSVSRLGLAWPSPGRQTAAPLTPSPAALLRDLRTVRLTALVPMAAGFYRSPKTPLRSLRLTTHAHSRKQISAGPVQNKGVID